MSYTDTLSSLLPEYQFNLDAWPCQLKTCKCHFPLVLKKHEDAVFKRFLFFIIFKIYARIGCFEYQARTTVILKILSRAFFFFFSFDFSLHLNFSFVLSLSSLFHGYWPYYKNENFRSVSRTNGEWRSRRFKAPTEQVSKDARMRDASDMHVAITRPSVTW